MTPPAELNFAVDPGGEAVGQVPVWNGTQWVASPTPSGYLSLRQDFALNPSMAVGALTTAIQNAIVSAISAGKGLDLGADLWPINAPLTIGGNLSLRACGCAEVYGSVGGAAEGEVPGLAPFVQGGGIVQEAAGANILNITATAAVVHMRDVLLSFGGSSAFNNTGHGIYAVPTATIDGAPDTGLQNPRWDNVIVFGQDGNHYGVYTVNMVNFLISALRTYGGGGWYEECNTGFGTAYGNGTLIEPYICLFCGGNSDGFHMKSGSVGGAFPNDLNLVTMVRPQCNITSAAGTALASAYTLGNSGAAASPTNAQYTYRDVNDPPDMCLVAPDFEGLTYSNPVAIGRGTIVVGPELSPRIGSFNTAFGVDAMPGTPNGLYNTAIGATTLGGASYTGQGNTAIGAQALAAATTGGSNTAIGWLALQNNTTGANNTAVGYQALKSNVSANSSTAVGWQAMAANTSGANNTAVGTAALSATTVGGGNTAIGTQAGQGTTGSTNVAVGYAALAAAGVSSSNVAVGYFALLSTTGSGNVAVGYQALEANTSGSTNIAIGQNALANNLTGSTNVAIGTQAMGGSTSSASNVAIGADAGRSFVTNYWNVALGVEAGYTDGTNTTGDQINTVCLGAYAQATTNNVVALGSTGVVAPQQSVVIGGVASAAVLGGGQGVLSLHNATTAPTAAGTTAAILYASAGKLYAMGASGVPTLLAS